MKITCNMDVRALDAVATARSGDRRHTTLGWSCSVVVHGLLLGGMIALGVRMPPHSPTQPFHWDVTLVQSAGGDTPAPPQQQAEARPTSQAQMARAIHSATKPTQSQPTPITSTAMQATAQSDRRSTDQNTDRSPQHVTTPQESAQPVTQQVVMSRTVPPSEHSEPEDASAQSPVRETHPLYEQTTSHPEQTVTPMPTSSMSSSSLSQQTSDDLSYSWLGEILWKRVHTFKRYPPNAVADRLEGEVLLAAVIEANGVIAEIRVMKSSGYPLLDQAAIEAVQHASPLTLLRPLAHPRVSVEIPIAYHGHT